MNRIKSQFFLGLFVLFFTVVVYAQSAFEVKAIQINGLQGISRDTVFSYLPIKIGSKVDAKKSGEIIRDLYKTDFFDDVRLSRKKNTLVITVVQRPVISRIAISGNKDIPTDKLKQALKGLGFFEGSVFNKALLAKIKTALASQYFMLGKYNARVEMDVTKESRHRVAVKIIISEGKAAKIDQVKIIGNHVFSDKVLLKQFTLSKTNLFSFFTRNDQYSGEKLDSDLESLRSYYMDRGYLKFKIDSTQVSITPDRKSIYIIVNVSEGSQYKISGYQFLGMLVLSQEKLKELADFKEGEVFSRKDIMLTNQRVMRALGDKGYFNSNVNVIPKLNEKDKTVFLDLKIEPGRQTYVRNIIFSQNHHTNDEALRRYLLQKEGSLFSAYEIEESKHSLLLQPYITDVQMTTKAVPDQSDQVDLEYRITEQSAAELKGGIGYSQLNKFMIMGSINQRNVLGTGNSLDLNIANSRPSTSMSISYSNPYYTKSGIGRTISAYGSHFNSGKAHVSDYNLNRYGFSLDYSLPVSLRNSIEVGLGYENDSLTLEKGGRSKQMSDFVKKHGKKFHQLNFTCGWSRQNFDRYVFPTKGSKQSLSVLSTIPIDSKSLEYYKTDFSAWFYHPIYKGFIGQLRANIGYGDGYGEYSGGLPFFKNFYSGGVGSVRGFSGNTLGPRDSKGDPLGGRFEADGTVGLVLPNFISEQVRLTWFVDVGNVYNVVKLSKLRYSTGISIDWHSPIGILNFSFSKPLNKGREKYRDQNGSWKNVKDETETFQFNIGAYL